MACCATTPFTLMLALLAATDLAAGEAGPGRPGYTIFESDLPTGLAPASAEQTQAMQAQTLRVRSVLPNRLRLERVNAERAGQGQAVIPVGQVPLARDFADLVGDQAGAEVVPPVAAAAEATSLPRAVDNGSEAWFPPIVMQVGSSCAVYSSTYYCMSYHVARSRGWNLRDDPSRSRCFSPKFLYNLVNEGKDQGSNTGNNFAVQQRLGVPFWPSFNPDDNKGGATYYREWPLTAPVWREACHYRMGHQVVISDEDSEANTIALLKAALANGYVGVISSAGSGMAKLTITDDPSTTADDAYVGRPISGGFVNAGLAHAMTLVGYNDDIWCDLNGNGVVDAGEKGAFRIANSWGTGDGGWNDGGFRWVAYDACFKESQVPGNIIAGRQAYRVIGGMQFTLPRPAHQPTLLAEVTLTHATRSDLEVWVGATSSSTSDAYLRPSGILAGSSNSISEDVLGGRLWGSRQYANGGAYAFDGSTSPVPCTFVWDLTDLRTDQPQVVISIKDDYRNGACTLHSVRLTRADGTVVVNAFAGVSSAQQIDGATRVLRQAVSRPDSTPPAAVTDLAFTGFTTTSDGAIARATFSWTAVGDDGLQRFLMGRYEVRQHTAPITSATWSQATDISFGGRQYGIEPGGLVTLFSRWVGDAADYPPGSTWHVAVRAKDAKGQWGGVSNCVSFTMPGGTAQRSIAYDVQVGGTTLDLIGRCDGVATSDQVLPGLFTGLTVTAPHVLTLRQPVVSTVSQ